MRAAFTRFLLGQGHSVIEAADGATALDELHHVDLVLLDIMLPGLDGWQVIEHLRENLPDLPVIMITALGALDDRLKGFGLGADDYMIKPVDFHELEARIKVILRRKGFANELQHGGLVLRPDSREVVLDGEPVSLSPLEFDVLITLARRPGRIWSRDELIAAAWGADYFGMDRTVDVRVANLRRKLGDTLGKPRFIRTVRNTGYQFVPQE